MKYLFLVLSLTIFGLPSLAYAHAGDASVEQEPRTLMMRQIEDASLGDELHVEMERLMEGLIDGDLTDAEVARMAELMDSYPGAGSIMMGRMMGMSNVGSFGGNPVGTGMMGYGFGLGGGLFMALLWVLAIISIVALIKYIRENA